MPNARVGVNGSFNGNYYSGEYFVETRRRDMKPGTLLRLTKEGRVYPTRQYPVVPKRGRPKKHKKVIQFIGVFIEYEGGPSANIHKA